MDATTVDTKVWANSGDSHFLEPQGVLQERLADALPDDLAARMPRTERDGDWEIVSVDGKTLRRRVPKLIDSGDFEGMDLQEVHDRPPGAWDARRRLQDMDEEGVWGQLVFPSLGIWNNMIEHRELSRVIASVTNDWADEEIQQASPRLVCTALIPLRDVDDAVAEVERVAEKGFKAVFIPTSPPTGVMPFNHDQWKPLWAAVAERGLVLASHVGTGGDVDFNVAFRGPGGAISNYVETTFTTQRLACQLVACGALDQNPGLRLMVSEGGSAWVPFLGDRMNEAYRQHSMFTRPKLSRSPKDILMEQVYSSFQHDETGALAFLGMGYRNGMWGDDYPHIEGTFGHSQQTLRDLFGDLDPDVSHRLRIGAFLDLFPHVGLPEGVEPR